MPDNDDAYWGAFNYATARGAGRDDADSFARFAAAAPGELPYPYLYGVWVAERCPKYSASRDMT